MNPGIVPVSIDQIQMIVDAIMLLSGICAGSIVAVTWKG